MIPSMFCFAILLQNKHRESPMEAKSSEEGACTLKAKKERPLMAKWTS